MDVIYSCCCGLDVHKKTVAACLITSTEGPEPVKEIRTFRTMTADLLAAAVVTDIYGVSARAMLAAILAGERDVETLADLARGRLRAKRDQLREALEGRVTAHHSFLLTEHLSTLEYLDEAIARIS